MALDSARIQIGGHLLQRSGIRSGACAGCLATYSAYTYPEISISNYLLRNVEVLTQLKLEFPDVRIIMVTGSTDRDTVQAAIQGGASGYLVKPFNAAKVVTALELALGRKPTQN